MRKGRGLGNDKEEEVIKVDLFDYTLDENVAIVAMNSGENRFNYAKTLKQRS